ncbi:MAG: ABC-2 family transporter protein, partial [Peptoanaerobacter stomatis]|uniref:ABC-2 family transporter protein n=1 Tax=Peptoanaerobacter stomatis TaxID=796937 RepID=UPI003FA0C4E9
MINLLKRYLLLVFMFARNSLAGQLEYRVNFIMGVLVEAGFLVVKLTYVVLIYKTGVNINGMSPDYMLVFIGTYTIMTGIYMSFYTNFWNLTNYIREGTLDLYLTKPVSGLFLVTFRYIDFATPLPAITAGFIMLGIGWHRCGFSVNFTNIGIFTGCLTVGTVLTYSL